MSYDDLEIPTNCCQAFVVCSLSLSVFLTLAGWIFAKGPSLQIIFASSHLRLGPALHCTLYHPSHCKKQGLESHQAVNTVTTTQAEVIVRW